MELFIDEFRKELELFWIWEGLTPEEYESGEKHFKTEKFHYPYWQKLMEHASKAITIIRNGVISLDLINLLLEAIAIDNENESIMENCERFLKENAKEKLAEAALSFPMYEARWQIAELLGRSNNDFSTRILVTFTKDNNKYVQRRALISLSRMNPKKAEEIALKKLDDSDDYLRLVSLRILRDFKSEYLCKAIELLKNDEFIYIQEEVDLIKKKYLI